MDIEFVKGHGTLNDFVLVPEPDVELTVAQIRFLCDRRAGVGADGLLRVVRSTDPEAQWFMDYRNADGSIAEMCGNGLRVFARFLVDEGLESQSTFMVATRAGLRSADVRADGSVRISMGKATISQDVVNIRLGGREFSGNPVDVGNPHAVCPVGIGVLSGLRLEGAPEWLPESAFPHGVNVEWVERHPDRLRMRVFERGVGETCSCGTGTVAVAAWAASTGGAGPFVVEVPGGEVIVEFIEGEAWLTGPTALVARGRVMIPEEAE